MMIDLDKIAFNVINWIGSPKSIMMHTIAFGIPFMFLFLDISFTSILLGITTIVSLEAIYLSIFIQMTINKNTKSIEDISDKIEDVQEDIDEIREE